MHTRKYSLLSRFQIVFPIFFVALYLLLIFCNYADLNLFSQDEIGRGHPNSKKTNGKINSGHNNELFNAVKRGVLSEHEALFYEKTINE